jgi:hypothetical protein
VREIKGGAFGGQKRERERERERERFSVSAEKSDTDNKPNAIDSAFRGNDALCPRSFGMEVAASPPRIASGNDEQTRRYVIACEGGTFSLARNDLASGGMSSSGVRSLCA